MNLIWVFLVMLVAVKVGKIEAFCRMFSVNSSTQTYGNYYDYYGNFVCCGYTYEVLYDFMECNIKSTTNVEDLKSSFIVTQKANRRAYNIKYILFSSSSIPTLYAGTFDNFTTITQLYLNASDISEIQPGAFNGIEQLQEINLSLNNLTEITRGVFNHLTKLTRLNLSHNYIGTIEKNSFMGLTQLQTLVLSYNLLTFVPSDVSGLKYLSQIDLSHNQICLNSNTSYQPFNSTSITQLNLSFNLIQNLSLDLFNLSTLTHLDLSNNMINNLHKDLFDNLTSLEVLNLQNNNLDYIPIGLFHTLSSLKYLNVSGNKLSEFEYGTFLGLENVILFDLSNNSIISITETTFHSFVQLSELYLHHNLLSTIDYWVSLNHLKMLKKVSLDNNPWTCKSLLSVVNQLKHNNVVVKEGMSKKTTNVNGIACYNSKSLKNQYEFTTTTNNDSSSITNYNWNQFNNFFNEGFFNTSFYKFLKNSTNLNFESKLTNVFQKQIDDTLNYTISKLVTSIKEIEEEKTVRNTLPNAQPHFEKFSDNFEERFLAKLSDIQSNNLIIFVIIVIVLICLLAVVTIKNFYNTNSIPNVQTESRANLELI